MHLFFFLFHFEIKLMIHISSSEKYDVFKPQFGTQYQFILTIRSRIWDKKMK